jgi:hypothetical protein
MPGNGIRQFPFAIACMGDYRMAAIHTIMVEPSSIALMPMLRSIAPGSACPGVESGSSAAASREPAGPAAPARLAILAAGSILAGAGILPAGVVAPTERRAAAQCAARVVLGLAQRVDHPEQITRDLRR